MFDRGSDLRPCGIGPLVMHGHRLAGRAVEMDLRGQPGPGDFLLVLLRPIRRVRPDSRAGVRLIQKPALDDLLPGIGHAPARGRHDGGIDDLPAHGGISGRDIRRP